MKVLATGKTVTLEEIRNYTTRDKTTDETAYAYANKKEFSEFLKLDIDYTIIKKKPLNFRE